MLITIAYLRDYKEYVGTLGLWSFDVWSKYHPPGITRKKQILKYKGHFNIETLPLTLIALTENDRLIGMCSLTEEEGIRSDLKPWLSSLYVGPRFRKQGVGKKLISAIQKIAKKMNYEILYLLTNAELTEYFSKLGWSFIEESKLNGHPVSIMETSLDCVDISPNDD